jgi:hypothetical protein
MMLAPAPARAGATKVPAFQLNGLSWNCDGATGGTPAGSAVIGITGNAKNPVVHGTAQMRGLASNTTYTLRLYQSNGTGCSFISATEVTTNAKGIATATLSAPHSNPGFRSAFLVAFSSGLVPNWLSQLAPLGPPP